MPTASLPSLIHLHNADLWHLELQSYSTLQFFYMPHAHLRTFVHAVPPVGKLFSLPTLGLLSFDLAYSYLSLRFQRRHYILTEPSLRAPPPLSRLDSYCVTLCFHLANDSKSWLICYYFLINSLCSQHLT